MLGQLWEWFGDQGWEYLDLGKAWQIGLAAGLVIWVVLLFRAVRPSFSDPDGGELSVLFFLSGLAIPVFYLPAFFYNSSTNFAIVDHWRFWIIHLWVEDFFELFVTVVVAVLFFRLVPSRSSPPNALSISMRFYTLWAASSARPIIGISRVNRA